LLDSRRGKLEIFYDILSAISDENLENGAARPTRVHHRAKLPYDRMQSNLTELENLRMISKSSLSITEKGVGFLAEYNKIKDLQAKIERLYFSK
jgi:predicted transcriptional regulator